MFLPLDLGMDLCILLMVQRSLDRICVRRLLRAQLVLTGFTILSTAIPAFAGHARICVYPLAALALLGRRLWKRIPEAAAGIFCAYAAAAGFAMLAGDGWAQLILCMLLFSMLFKRKRHPTGRWNIEILLEKDGARHRFPALIDTGNRLREHMSGLPVLIVEEAAVPRIAAGVDPAECRALPYGVLGSAGEILCFRPDSLRITGCGAQLANECRVALFPGRIPGRICALAPPEFAEFTQESPKVLIAVQNTIRRIYHGVFKCKAVHLRPGCSDSQGFGMLHRRERPLAAAAHPGGGSGPGAQGARRG